MLYEVITLGPRLDILHQLAIIGLDPLQVGIVVDPVDQLLGIVQLYSYNFV